MDSITVFDLSTGLLVKKFVESPMMVYDGEILIEFLSTNVPPLINSIYEDWSKRSSINGTNPSLVIEYCGFKYIFCNHYWD